MFRVQGFRVWGLGMGFGVFQADQYRPHGRRAFSGFRFGFGFRV